LNSKGKDSVSLLNQNSYKPDGRTALYKTVFQVLQEIAANIVYSYSKAISATFTIAIITDGEDTEKGVDPNDIKAIVKELKGNKYLVSSLVVGIEHPDLPREKIIGIKNKLGFDDVAFTNQNPAEIRRAFDVPSQSALRE
jgi:hypothetical protein